MKYAILSDGRVTDIAQAQAALADNWVVIPPGQAVEIGDGWDGSGFFEPAAKLVEEKKQAHQLRRQLRTQAQDVGIVFGGRRVATDPQSRQLIAGAAQAAQVAVANGTEEELAAMVGGWRGVDGSIVAQTAAELIELGMAVVAHIAACDKRSQAIKAMIDAAETVAAVRAAVSRPQQV